jgi:hypothetical protein
MDRAEQRRLSRGNSKKTKTYNLTNEQLADIRKQIIKEAMIEAVHGYSSALALCLKDKLGFGKTRAIRFMRDVEEIFASINEGYLSVDDVLKTVKEELDIEIVK